MDRVGGYTALLALEADATAYDDVVTLLRAEADAAAESRVEARVNAALGKSGG